MCLYAGQLKPEMFLLEGGGGLILKVYFEKRKKNNNSLEVSEGKDKTGIMQFLFSFGIGGMAEFIQVDIFKSK